MSNESMAIRGDPRPLYTQARQALREMIESGQVKPGEQMPSEEELARRFGISRSTVRRALGYLETHGLISRKQGLGTFVTSGAERGFLAGLERLESFRSLAERAGLKATVEFRKVETTGAPQAIASALGVEVGKPLTRIQVVEAVNGIRAIYIDDYFFGEIVDPEFIQSFDGPVLDYVASQVVDPISHTRSEILAIDAPPEIAAMLETPIGKSLLHFREVHYARSGRLVGATHVYVLTDQFRFYIVRKVI